MEPDADQFLAAYLSKVRGVSCVLPIGRVRELTGAALPPVTAAWWTDANGWSASPAPRACQAAGWRLESLRIGSELVRFMRTEGVDDASTD